METEKERYPGRLIMPFVVLALLAALWAGLLRLGWRLPPLQPQLAGAHGPLMVVGFLGTLIALERAVALRKAVVSGCTSVDRRRVAAVDFGAGDGGCGVDDVGQCSVGAGFGRNGAPTSRPAHVDDGIGGRCVARRDVVVGIGSADF